MPKIELTAREAHSLGDAIALLKDAIRIIQERSHYLHQHGARLYTATDLAPLVVSIQDTRPLLYEKEPQRLAVPELIERILQLGRKVGVLMQMTDLRARVATDGFSYRDCGFKLHIREYARGEYNPPAPLDDGAVYWRIEVAA